MTLKLIDLFEIKYITYKNILDREKFNNIEVHNILNLNNEIRKQFILLVSTYFKNIFVVHLFKNIYKNDNLWSRNRIQYLHSFSLSQNIKNSINWRDIDKKIINIEEDYFIIDETQDNSILTEDYDFYIEIKNNFKFFNIDDEKKLESKIWGKPFNQDSIKWQVMLSNTMTTIYGTGIDNLYYRCKSFKNGNLCNIYYNSYDKKSLIFEKFVNNKVIYCDTCHMTKRISTNFFYHHSHYGDICSYCFKMKKEKEDYRKKYFLRFMKSVGKRSIFQKELEKTKNFLQKYDIKELSDTKKYNLMLRINRNLNKKEKRNECSICLDELSGDIYVSSCGHCLHAKCYFMLKNLQCPVCRNIGTFRKLHL